MNIHDDMSDDDVLRAAATSLSTLPVAVPPAAETIMARGRARRRRTLTGLGLAGTAGAMALALGLGLGLTGVFGSAPARSTGATGTVAPARSTGTIRTAAFTLTSNANGTDTLTLTHSQMFDPATLQRALVRHGIRALVKTGAYCWSSPAAPDPASLGVLSIRSPFKPQPPRAGTVLVPGDLKPNVRNWIVNHTVTVINPAAMPSGTELFFGYFNSDHLLFFDLIYTSSHTCSTGQPAANP